MIRAIVRNGELKLLQPLPDDWAEGTELLIETAGAVRFTSPPPIASESPKSWMLTRRKSQPKEMMNAVLVKKSRKSDHKKKLKGSGDQSVQTTLSLTNGEAISSSALVADGPPEASSDHARLVIVCGVSILKSQCGVVNGRKSKDGDAWVITTRKSDVIARFSCESDMEQWWIAFQNSQGRVASPLSAIQAPNTSNPNVVKKTKRSVRQRGAMLPPIELPPIYKDYPDMMDWDFD